MKNEPRKNRILWGVLGALFLIALWFFVSAIVGNPLLFPSPVEVVSALGRLMLTSEFYASVGRSLLSVLSGFIAGNVLGILLGVVSGLSSKVSSFVKPGMAVIKATPVASFIILVLIWMGRVLTPMFTSFLIVLPVVWQNVLSGMLSADPKQLEVAKVFSLPLGKKLKHIYLPAAFDGYLAALRTSMGFAWKAGVAAEVIAGAGLTLGGHIYTSKVYIETPELFAWTIAVVAVSLLVELLAAGTVRLIAGRRRSREQEGGGADV